MGEASTASICARSVPCRDAGRLQGAGKTTTAGKLARWLIDKQHKKVLMVSTTSIVRRPFCSCRPWPARWARVSPRLMPARRRRHRQARADRSDSPGLRRAAPRYRRRLHIDAEMMAEVGELEAALKPHERLFVVDSMPDRTRSMRRRHSMTP